MIPSRFLIPVLDKWLLHAPLHEIQGLVNQGAARTLQLGKRPEDEALSSLWDVLVEPAAEPRPREGDICPSFLGIIPTRGCNMDCGYCNFGGPTASWDHMDPSIAVAAVDWMADRLVQAGRDLFQIHFFGGEPFVSPEIVDIVVHRARLLAARHGLRTYFDASTNGMFNEKRRQFIGDYFGGIVLSFDGPPEFHNKNRPAFKGRPSFEVVARTAERLREMPLDLCLRVCITQDSVTHMERITEWMCRTYQPSVINFETLTPGAMAQKAGLQVPDPYDFAVHCLGSYRIAADHGIQAVYSAAEWEKTRLSFCPVGTDALIVSLDGRASACYLLPEDWRARGLDLDLGWVRPTGKVEIDFEALIAARRLPAGKPRCQGCFCQWSCAGGCHVNHTYPGCSTEYDDFCLQTRIITACLLLEDLGYPELVDRLLADREAMTELATRPTDVFCLDASGPSPSGPRPFSAPVTGKSQKKPRSLIAEGLGVFG